jgi:hypothetical protein
MTLLNCCFVSLNFMVSSTGLGVIVMGDAPDLKRRVLSNSILFWTDLDKMLPSPVPMLVGDDELCEMSRGRCPVMSF